MKRLLFVISVFWISIIVSCQSFISSSLKMGDTKVYISGSDVIIENFHGPAIGIAGIGRVTWGEFSWDKLDEFVYKQAKKSSDPVLWIVLRYASEDQYGNKSLDAPITIGKIDVAEVKKYQSFDYWHRSNKTIDMWEKDKKEYDRYIESITRRSNSTAAFVVPSYRPKSIR